MIGLSGGGWTTVLYAALDERINKSYPVAGSYPIYIREQTVNSVGDFEQSNPDFYNQVSYLELYALASQGRRQLQFFNYYDTCCFHGSYSDTYKDYLADVAQDLGGSFDVVLDYTHARHQISPWTMTLILEDLDE